MTSSATKRSAGWVLFLLCSALCVWLQGNYTDSIPGFTYLSGWALLFVMLLLTLYNGRKKIPFLPL